MPRPAKDQAMGIAKNSNVAGNGYRNAGNRTFNGLVGESVDAQSVGNGGNRPTTHTGDTDSLAEKLATLRSWVEQGLERSGRRSHPCSNECVQASAITQKRKGKSSWH
jgi:hypothetical protein